MLAPAPTAPQFSTLLALTFLPYSPSILVPLDPLPLLYALVEWIPIILLLPTAPGHAVVWFLHDFCLILLRSPSPSVHPICMQYLRSTLPPLPQSFLLYPDLRVFKIISCLSSTVHKFGQTILVLQTSAGAAGHEMPAVSLGVGHEMRAEPTSHGLVHSDFPVLPCSVGLQVQAW